MESSPKIDAIVHAYQYAGELSNWDVMDELEGMFEGYAYPLELCAYDDITAFLQDLSEEKLNSLYDSVQSLQTFLEKQEDARRMYKELSHAEILTEYERGWVAGYEAYWLCKR